MKGFSSECIALKVDVLKEWKIYCLQVHKCVPASFSPEIVQARTVKGLIYLSSEFMFAPKRNNTLFHFSLCLDSCFSVSAASVLICTLMVVFCSFFLQELFGMDCLHKYSWTKVGGCHSNIYSCSYETVL